MSFATLAGMVWGVGLLTATAWAAARQPPGLGRPAVWLLLGAAVVSVPWVPSPHLPLRVQRAHYAGPDLLSDVRERTVVTRDSARAAGFSRVRRLRRIQGATLLSEDRRVGLRIPWLWALLVVVVGLSTLRRRHRIAGSSRLVWILTCSALTAACGAESGPSPAEARLIEVMEMRRTGDVTGIETVFLPEGVYEDVAGDFEYRGVPEIAGYLSALHGWATGVFLDVVEIRAAEDWASAEWFLQGVQSGPIPGRLDTITGRPFRLRGVTLIELERGGVARAADYLDWVPFLMDMGAEIHWPGGGVTTGSSDGAEAPGSRNGG